MSTPILLHINYFEQGQSLERACELTRQLGADGLEFRRKPGNFPGSDLEYLDEVSSALDRHPLEWVSFGAPGADMMLADADARERELEAAEAFFRKAAARFPLKVVNTFTGTLANADRTLPFVEYWHHGSTVATPEQWANATAGFQRLGALAGELGFRFAFETHGVYLHDSVEATMRLVNAIGSPQVGLLWDHANLLLFPTTPSLEEVIAQAGASLFYVHLKNLLFPAQHFLAVSSLSAGIINVREQLSRLKAAGYTGPICLEAPRPGDREQFAKEDLAYVRELLAAIN